MSSGNNSGKVAAYFLFALFLILLLKSCDRSTLQFVTFIGNNHRNEAKFGLASYYQDHMVLQAEPYNAVIWGYGVLGSTVELFVKGKTFTGHVDGVIDGQGVWRIVLDQLPPGTKADVSITHETKNGVRNMITIHDVLFGDVWVCSGQSNMVFPIAHMFNYSQELDLVSQYPDIRIFTAAQTTSDVPLYDLKSISRNWEIPTKDNVQSFSAVCWVYARHLHDVLKIPIGLVETNWGGTPVETWSSTKALAACGLQAENNFKTSFSSRFFTETENVPPPHQNSVLWNAMIHPFLNMTIKGAIWYQGEANSAYHRDQYNCSFPTMIKDWRSAWLEGTHGHTNEVFPFGFVQLASITSSPENGEYPVVRWHQTADFGYVPNSAMPETFMAAALDLADPDSPYGSVHIRDKEDVGLRLSSAALHHIFKLSPDKSGPRPIAAAQVIDTVVLQYSSDNLVVNDGRKSNFEICCLGSNCDISDLTESGFEEWLPSGINDYGSDTVQILGQACKDQSGVKRVRYAWRSTPCAFKDCQLYSKQGAPAPPFVIDVQHDKESPISEMDA